MKQDLIGKRTEIQELGLEAIKEYFQINPNSLDKNILIHLMQKAKIGLQFEKEMNLSQRSIELNTIRITRMISENKKEMKKLLMKSMAQYIPK